MSYRGKFFDGEQLPIDVSIDLEADAIVLTRVDGDRARQCWSLMRIDRVRSNSDGVVILKYNSTPPQRLHITDVSFDYSLHVMYPHYGFSKSNKKSSSSRLLLFLLAALLVVIGAVVAAYIWLLPAITDRMAMHIPTKYEQQLGKELTAGILQSEKKNTAASETINRFFSELHFNKHDSVKLFVVKSEEVNAFALPGGSIVVYDEIIRKTQSADELAALLAHEYSHVHYRHSLRSMVKGLSSWLLIAIVTGGNSEILGALAQNADQLRQLKYSRDFEREADANALRLLKRNHLNPRGMVDLMKTLQAQETAPGSDLMQQDFLSTHPVTSDRIKFAEASIAQKDFETRSHEGLDSIYGQLQREVKGGTDF